MDMYLVYPCMRSSMDAYGNLYIQCFFDFFIILAVYSPYSFVVISYDSGCLVQVLANDWFPINKRTVN